MKTPAIRIASCLTLCGFLTQPCGAGGNRSDTTVFSAAERALCARLSVGNQPWARARWEVSLTEARQRAEREHKPIFLVVNTGNVLGFV